MIGYLRRQWLAGPVCQYVMPGLVSSENHQALADVEADAGR